MDDRILASLAERGGLQTLKPAELDLENQPLTIDPAPKPVRVWVRFFDVPVLVHAYAHRWTPRAVGVKFIAGGKEHAAWVWASAVDPDENPPPPSDDAKYSSD